MTTPGQVAAVEPAATADSGTTAESATQGIAADAKAPKSGAPVNGKGSGQGGGSAPADPGSAPAGGGTPASNGTANRPPKADGPTAPGSGGSPATGGPAPTQGGNGGGGGGGQEGSPPATEPGPGTATAADRSRGRDRAATAAAAGNGQPKGSTAATSGRSSGAAGAASSAGSEQIDPPKRTIAEPRQPVDAITQVVVRIVEVIPFWAKLLIGALAALVVGLAVGAHFRLRQRARDYRYRSLHDPLTGLPNRAMFADEVTSLLAGEETAAILLIDLDGFKDVNDTLGHSRGDRLLVEVAAKLRSAVRDADTVARLGGDEFAVLLPSVRDEVAAARIASALRDVVQDSYPVEGLTVHTDASIGIALAPLHGSDAETLVRCADIAMYSAKQRRVGVAMYDARHDHHSPARLSIVGDLRRAIAAGELALYCQPQVDPRRRRVDSIEALVRWQHPAFGTLEPHEFIPMAERAGLMRPLTMWVLDAAMSACAGWRNAGLELSVSVNLSMANLVDTELPAAIAKLLERHQLPSRLLRLEITESAAMSDPARTRAVLAELDALGAQLAIDDFGTGYSSLAHLRGLPVRELKIDRSFVARMMTDPNDLAIVTATIDLGHNLGLRVVAEGVEDRQTLDELTRRGCDLVQGYLFARPLRLAELNRWLAAWTTVDPRRLAAAVPG